jgi:hypothetical protein
MVDSVAGLLDGPRARGAFLLRSTLDPPWSMRIQDHAPLTLVAVVRGDAWVIPDGGGPEWLHAGDVAVLRGPDEYVVADDPATAPQVVIRPGQRCTTASGEELTGMTSMGVRSWGNSRDGQSILLTGTYQLRSETLSIRARAGRRRWSDTSRTRSQGTSRGRRRFSIACWTCC